MICFLLSVINSGFHNSTRDPKRSALTTGSSCTGAIGKSLFSLGSCVT